MKRISSFQKDDKRAVVHMDTDWDEFRVQLWINSKCGGWVHAEEADYHTSCEDDALDTAKAMVE